MYNIDIPLLGEFLQQDINERDNTDVRDGIT